MNSWPHRPKNEGSSCSGVDIAADIFLADTFIKMYRFFLTLVLVAMVYLRVANLAGLMQSNSVSLVGSYDSSDQNKVVKYVTLNDILDEPPTLSPPALAYSQNSAQNSDPTSNSPAATDKNDTNLTITTINSTIATSTTTTTTLDPNVDPEDSPVSTPSGTIIESNSAKPTPNEPAIDNRLVNITNGKPTAQDGLGVPRTNLEFNILLYSIFIVYVSFIKLIYHNVAIINYNLNEPGILMIFGIVWELVARQVSTNYDSFPRFNSRIFFYLFLPSTVLESASLLSNKWLFLNLFPIMVHSIIGTLLYSSAMGFTIYSLGKQNIFNLNISIQTSALYTSQSLAYNITLLATNDTNLLRQAPELELDLSDQLLNGNLNFKRGYMLSSSALEISNLTLTDCLLFGTILSSIESNTMLGISKLFHVNERLYYLILGENLMNNAVVLVLFNLLLEFFNATRLTVVKIYFAILEFFITLVGSIFIGLALAGVALISVRLTKKFQVPNASTSQQSQYQAMVETLLILKLAYLAYTLASLAGTSRIVSLATFGILQDQYIKHNLNLRSQLTFRQVILATKTLGFSLVYPLLGMLLVEVANSSQFFQYWSTVNGNLNNLNGNPPDAIGGQQTNPRAQASGAIGMLSAANLAASRLGQLANQANLYWNFKFIALAMLLVVVYRFVIVLVLSFLCNIFSSSPTRIKFKEQILVAYGGLKGPLAMALVQRLIEHEEYRDRTLKNKHLFMYTILFITFVSTVVFGSFVKPIVVKVQKSLDIQLRGSQSGNTHNSLQKPTVLFDQINLRATEYVSVGLNSILGHSKSPYDRFADWNELHIKPWLSRSETNTNWLSVFYDNLILDETLNANCFYRTTDARLAHHLRARSHFRPSNINTSNSGAKLDTIDENSQLLRHRRRGGGNNNRPKLSTTPKGSSFGSSTGGRHKQPRRQPSKPRDSAQLVDLQSAIAANNNVALKEFVMLNLRLEDARSRRQSLTTANRWGPSAKVAPTKGIEEELVASSSRPTNRVKQRQMITRMLSTTSSDVADGELTSAEHGSRRDKHKHLAQVESLLDPKHLEASRANDPVSDLSKNKNNLDSNISTEQQRRRTTATRYSKSNEPRREVTLGLDAHLLNHSPVGLLRPADGGEQHAATSGTKSLGYSKTSPKDQLRRQN